MITSVENYKSKQKFYQSILRSRGGQGARYTMEPRAVYSTSQDGILLTSTSDDVPLPTSATGFQVSKMKITASHSVFMFNVNLFDMLTSYGDFAFNSNYTTINPPTIPTARLPNGSFLNTELWFCARTTFTGQPTLIYSYINQDGITRNITYALAFTPTSVTTMRLPLFSGDTGVQKLLSIQCTVATVGTFLIFIARFICANTFKARSKSVDHSNLIDSGCAWIPDNACLQTINIQNLAAWTTLTTLELVYV